MAKCLVLGGNGFLGSHLVDSLVGQGHTVRAFDRFSRGTKFEAEGVEVVTGDFMNRHELNEALKDMEYVFHFISTTTPFTAENDPLIDIETNIRMSVELFDECVKQNIKKVIFASTSSIYGPDVGDEPISEMVIPEPVSPYAIGKLAIEHYLHYFNRKHNLESVTFRISNPYGERQAPNSKQGVIPIFLEKIANNEPIAVFGDGSMVRDYIYIKDVADMVAKSFKDTKHHLYNLGSGHGESLSQIMDEIKQVVGRELQVDHKPSLSTFVPRIVLDASRFQNEFGLKPQVSLHDGIQKTWQYIESQHEKN